LTLRAGIVAISNVTVVEILDKLAQIVGVAAASRMPPLRRRPLRRGGFPRR
jgi:hypothetical protein